MGRLHTGQRGDIGSQPYWTNAPVSIAAANNIAPMIATLRQMRARTKYESGWGRSITSGSSYPLRRRLPVNANENARFLMPI